jgi:PAS domain S-box-containing protein
LKTTITQHDALNNALLDQSNFFITDKQGVITYASNNFCQLSGYSENELIGKEYWYMQNNCDDGSLHTSIIKHLQNNKTWKGEIHNFKKNSLPYWLESTISVLPGDNGHPDQYLHLHSDVSHTKELLTSLDNRARKQGLLAIIGQLSLMNHNDLQIFIEQTIAAITGTLDMSCGMIYSINKNHTQAILCAHAGISSLDNATGFIDLTENNILSHALNLDKSILIDLKTENRFQINTFFKQQNSRYCVCKRIGNNEEQYSIILLFSDSYNTIQPDDASFLQAVSNIIAETIIRKNISDELISEKILSQKYIDVANIIIVALNSTGNIVLANKKAALTLDHEQEELIGMDWYDNFTPIDEATKKTYKSTLTEIFDNASSSGIPDNIKNITGMILTKTGDQRLIKWKSALLQDQSGEAISIIRAGEDITEIEKIKQDKKKLQSELQQAQKMEALGQLTGGIAHDFNNVLAGILGFSQLAIENTSDDESEQGIKLTEYLSEIETAGYRGKEIINQMLSFSRTHNEELKNVALPSLVKDTLKMLRATIPSSMTFNIFIDDEVPAVIADPSNLNQVIMNLLINARDVLNSKGTLTVSVFEHKEKTNTCSSCNEKFIGHYINLSISDNGPGIKKLDLPLIFNDEFTTKEQNKGFGKGLATVNKIVHESKGHIIVDTSPEGTTFNVLFEVATGLSKTEKKTATLEKPVDTNKHILVVDDDNTIAKYLEEMFTQCGYKVSLFTDPTQALTAFKENPSSFDMLLTDQTMPMITGAELAQKAMSIRPEIPVVICTGHSDLIDEEKAADMNIKEFLRKPIETHKLLECVYRLLK